MKYRWEYRAFGDFTYNVLPPEQVDAFLNDWIRREWETDHRNHPEEPWTNEWLSLLPRFTFRLVEIPLADIVPRRDLMSNAWDSGSFEAELHERAREREEALLRGVSLEPLVINGTSSELMDGYTRFTVLGWHRQESALAYAGTPRPSFGC